MVTIKVHCPYCQSDALVRNGRAPMVSRNTSAVQALGKAGKIRPRMPTQRSVVKRSCVPMKSGAVCVDWSEHLVSHGPRW